MWFDPMYLVILAPAMLIGMWAQSKVRSAYSSASRVPAGSRLSGAEAARGILHANGLDRVSIEMTPGMMSDHYDPRAKVLRLSPDVYRGRSLASLGIAAHEAGHAIQDATGYAPLKFRNGVVPLANIGSGFSWAIVIGGLIFQSTGLIWAGIALFGTVVLFQLINLPVEFDASARARRVLLANGMVAEQEDRTVGKVLNAAAWTYVAGTLTAIATLLYFVLRFGGVGGRND